MIEQLQSDFLFWIFIYFLIVGLLIRNIHLTRKIKSIEKKQNVPSGGICCPGHRTAYV